MTTTRPRSGLCRPGGLLPGLGIFGIRDYRAAEQIRREDVGLLDIAKGVGTFSPRTRIRSSLTLTCATGCQNRRTIPLTLSFARAILSSPQIRDKAPRPKTTRL
jgi:hypothetical protein